MCCCEMYLVLSKFEETLIADIDDLRKKKKLIKNDIKAMTASADKHAEEAEKKHQITSIAKSNSLRRSANEKAEELILIEQEINRKLQAAQSHT